ncbi:MAG: hypothetical protein KF696_10695 [Planctomycetes bacterium]|nr:hypothetical protein [Planctomycetota bacterium]MCW8135102.1 hypothetical protein [Planctomycetota bacterium]
MKRDRLTLLALISTFLLVSACELPWENEKEKKRLPDRAPGANGLLRHYYDTLTFPSRMTAIKIPEGEKFDNGKIEFKFPMGNGEIVNDVRVRLYMLPPAEVKSDNFPDVQAKVIAPDGTSSKWTGVSFMTGSGTSITIDLNAEVHWPTQFDGVSTDGTWKLQLRDPKRDEDGRCILRNATLRLNLGIPAGATFSTETSTVPLVDGPYTEKLPELNAPRVPFDLGHIGAGKPVRLSFQFTNSFTVTGLRFTWNIRSKLDADASQDMFFYIISPSGGWWCPSVTEIAAASSFTDPSGTNDDKYSNFVLSMSQADVGHGDRFAFLGEPSAGTWTVLLFDYKKDGVGLYMTDVDGSGPGVEAELILS